MSRFKLHKKNFALEVLEAEFMQAEMLRRAKLVEAEAIRTAPVYKHYEGAKREKRRYISNFKTSSGVRTVAEAREVGRNTRRAYGRVENTSPHALFVEFGGSSRVIKTARHRTLGRALKAAGTGRWYE